MDPRIEQITRFPVPVVSPSAGSEIVIKNTGLGLWRITSLVYQLATSAVVANRVSTLTLSDGTNVYWRSLPGAAQAASLTWKYTAYAGSFITGAIGTNVEHGWPVDGVSLPSGHILSTVTDAIDVGDAYSAIVVYVEEYPSGPYLQMTPQGSFTAEPYSYE